jgi:16S rRNA (cytosine1402-N4)-methyltransferase
VNGYTINDLVRIFQVYGEERFARKIAQEISRRRKARSFKTTTELANFIEKLIGRQGHIHPATRIFQALRIEVNHELDVLLSVLKQSVAVLKKNGRLEVIAYHSLEDRVVKQFFKECARDFINEPDKLTTTHLEPTLHIVTKKPLVPTDPEIAKNPRSRSAKLRIAEKI